MIFRRGAGGSGEQIVVTLLRAVAGGGRGPAPVAGGGEVKSPTASFSTQDASVLQSMTGLKGEFSNLSFLWGEPISDAVQDNMSDWKLNMLYGDILYATHPPLFRLVSVLMSRLAPLCFVSCLARAPLRSFTPPSSSRAPPKPGLLIQYLEAGVSSVGVGCC